MSRNARIAALNDAFRATFVGGRVLVSRGIASLPPELNARILQAVQAFDAFTPDNDPYGEHDFGSFVVEGHKVYWKVDYYDAAMQFGSEDPADQTKTTRVLTICLVEEY